MAGSLLDDLARALAEPVPRGRALRLLGATFVALAVPGMRPPVALARRGAECDYGCGTDVRGCPRLVQGAPGPPLCCGAPARRYRCEGTWFEPVCVDTCDGPDDVPCTGEKWSDGCAVFRCCKKPSKCMNGGCSESCKVETGIDSGKTVQFDPKTQCCTPFGARSKTSASARECAGTRRPRPNYKPTSNGCGTKTDKFPDGFTFKVTIKGKTKTGSVSFLDACNAHDVCYGTCRKEKDACDEAFRKATKDACAKAFPGRGRFAQAFRAECLDKAGTYGLGASWFGASAYWNAQSEACLCC